MAKEDFIEYKEIKKGVP